MNGRGAPTTFRRAELGSAPGATSSAMDVPPPTRVGPSGARPTANRHFALASGTRPYHPRYDQTRFGLRVVVRATCLTRCGPVWSGARKIGDGQATTNTPARAPTNKANAAVRSSTAWECPPTRAHEFDRSIRGPKRRGPQNRRSALPALRIHTRGNPLQSSRLRQCCGKGYRRQA